MTLCEVKSISGDAGNFEVEILKKPRYVDMDKCIACGACVEKCPKKVSNEYNSGLDKRKAIYVEYDQAVPLKFSIDPTQCIKLTKGKCGACEKRCPTGAINYDDKPETVKLNVGSVVLAPGFKPFDPAVFDTYQYSNFPNVVTALEFERLLSASGPTLGHLVKQSKDHEEPKKIAFFQCIGSRDINRCDNGYCSSVCCMYAIKEAVIAKEHAGGDLDCSIFYMDMRTHGKDFERYYNKAKEEGVKFVRSRVHTINPVPETGDLEVRYVNEEGKITSEVFNMIVLSIGLQIDGSTIQLAKDLGIELTPGNFAETETFKPVQTSRDGIIASGAFLGPRDIPQSMIDASAAAGVAGEKLASVRGTMLKTVEAIPERDVFGEAPRIGVFVCHCGVNIGGVVDVPSVAEYAKTLPFVEYTADNMFSCSQDTQDKITQIIKDENLNRIVVAACTPKTHEPLFQETLSAAGLNKYMFEMVNIRNQDSWVHKESPGQATEKAKDLVRMGVAKVALQNPLSEAQLKVGQTAMVVGGGLSGMAAAETLALQGYETHIIERQGRLGGNALMLYRTHKGEIVSDKVSEFIENITSNDNIKIHLNTTIQSVDGFVGNFTAKLNENGQETKLEHGVAVMATGGHPYNPTEYMYGEDPRILTPFQMDKKMKEDDPLVRDADCAVFIQCVGSREPDRPYCSRVCCSHSIDSALELKRRKPSMNVFIIYRDIRTYGEKEYLYKEARDAGVIFIRYSLENKPTVKIDDGVLKLIVKDHVLNRDLEIEPDVIALATAIIPNKVDDLSQFYKLPMNDDGFFIEAHAKLGPSEFATDGVFLAGLAHYPKPIEEAIAQGKAAASRAITLLARKEIFTSGQVARVDPVLCSGCGICASVCPYSAPSLMAEGNFKGRAEINPVLCKGCGLCVSSCRSGAIHHNGFDNDQIFSQIFAVNA
ncbi:MAG: heterodisulfide reductase [Deltaproteobacteria bacterium]|nr:MAG: heterodisulfide reductase [Deltaproteobacteria bacterium]